MLKLWSQTDGQTSGWMDAQDGQTKNMKTLISFLVQGGIKITNIFSDSVPSTN